MNIRKEDTIRIRSPCWAHTSGPAKQACSASDYMMEKPRCSWVPADNPLYVGYHDEEWGVPVHDDQKLFEFLLLEGNQAGLSWYVILKKRENFRAAFDQFNPKKIAW